MVFAEGYSGFYDLLYREKDYLAECDFLEEIFKMGGTNPRDILDLGCGTGGHALELQKRGFEVTGVDRSKPMLAMARAKAKKLKVQTRFELGDITSFQSGETFGGVIAMFAVMGYQTSNAELKRAVEVAFDHLKPDGTFIFDGWYGPAVLQQKPETRVKEIYGEDRSWLIRMAEPILDAFNHLVRIHYRLLAGQESRLEKKFEEIHIMRFFFPQELRILLEWVGFVNVRFFPFMDTGRSLTTGDWNMTVVANRPPVENQGAQR